MQWLIFRFEKLDESDNGSNLIQRSKHRQFLTDKSVFKKAIDIDDPKIVAKIRVNYRINYLKDSVIIYYVDDQTSNTFNTVTFLLLHAISS